MPHTVRDPTRGLGRKYKPTLARYTPFHPFPRFRRVPNQLPSYSPNMNVPSSQQTEVTNGTMRQATVVGSSDPVDAWISRRLSKVSRRCTPLAERRNCRNLFVLLIRSDVPVDF